MFNIFLAVFFSTLAFAFVEPFFFIGYLISIALFGLYQAIFMANAGGAWDNAKKIVEVELQGEGHAAARGDASSATRSAIRSRTPRRSRMNPIIKFTTLFGLLAVELAVKLTARRRGRGQPCAGGRLLRHLDVFVYRSFYGMRIGSGAEAPAGTRAGQPRFFSNSDGTFAGPNAPGWMENELWGSQGIWPPEGPSFTGRVALRGP